MWSNIPLYLNTFGVPFKHAMKFGTQQNAGVDLYPLILLGAGCKAPVKALPPKVGIMGGSLNNLCLLGVHSFSFS